MEELVKEMGFKDEIEFNKMVASIDLSKPGKMYEFLKWKENDGTKDGLIKISE